jgi:biofilm PGA synthesis N-glycosyltransferase PgaC
VTVAELVGSAADSEELSHRTLSGAARPLIGASDTSPLACSVGIMAYNEEANIAHAMEAVLGQQLLSGEIAELIVVASGCTDRTADIALEVARDDPRVRLVVQERREGKASAINLFISAARSPILLMVGADVLVKEGTIDTLVKHFRDPAVGMVGGHPIPVNDERRFLGHAVHLLWRLHDQIARRTPKLGEIVAFRNVVPSIPVDTAVDEISIQALTTQLGYQLVYEPRAIVYNRGPTTVGDFLRQRRRIYAGHLRVRKQQGYTASTMSVSRIGRALVRSGSFRTPRGALWTLCAVALEAIARVLGYYDSIRRQQHHVWKTVTTTKRHIAEGASARLEQNVLVFHIVDFPRQQLELGVRVSKQISRAVLRHIQEALGASAIVSAQQNGTIVAIVYGDRKKAEGAARSLLQELATNPFPLNGHRDGVPIALACGIVAFSPVGQPLARSIPDVTLDRGLATIGAG